MGSSFALGFGAGLLTRPRYVHTRPSNYQDLKKEKPLKCVVTDESIYFTKANFEQDIDIKEGIQTCNSTQDVCYGILTLLSANFTTTVSDNSVTLDQEVFQLVVKKGCTKKSEFVRNFVNDTEVQFSQSNQFCKRTNPVTESGPDGATYTVLDSVKNQLFAFDSSQAFNVSKDKLIKDKQVKERLPKLKWQMESCYCDWKMCNGSLKVVPSLIIILTIAMQWFMQ